MSILAAILLAVSGLVCAPVAWGTQALSVWQVRLLAALGTVLALAACLLGLVSGEHAPAWLAAPAAVIAAVGLGSALTVTALSATRVVGRATEASPPEAVSDVGEDVVEPAIVAPASGGSATAEPPADPGSPLLRGGALIGVFERIAISATLLAGWPEGLAVVLAVKGLGRFPELKQAHGQATSERFILGTLVSVLAAAACAGLGILLRG
ncbi:hypothetical protein [Galactobacter valiniphilus]|uniref:hypothetical protein n=1 Tax=Galactobacter valiniphilus TaxID=2676122 RepID=UPI003736FBCC